MNPFYLLAGLANLCISIVIYLNREFLNEFMALANAEYRSSIKLSPELSVLILAAVFAVAAIRLSYVGIRYPHAKSYPMIFMLAGYGLGAGSAYYLTKILPSLAEGGSSSDITAHVITFIVLVIIATISFLASALTMNKEMKRAKGES